jgi:uncharacterized protein YkwD
MTLDFGHTRPCVLALALLFSVCTAAAQADCGLPDFRRDALRLANEARATARQCGSQAMPAAGDLAWNDALTRAAAAHAQDMVKQDFFDHAGSDDRNVGDRMTAAGYRWRSAGENLALGPTSVAAAINGWLDSPSHCTAMMDARFRDMGLACVRNREGRPIWTMTLGTPR